MRVSYKWLKEFVDLEIPPEELAERLTMAGVAVEGVARPGQGISNVISARIDTVTPHPNADKLVVATVFTGRENLQVITAAVNVRAGDMVPVALVGARLAGGLVIKKTRLRGVESYGMMCSGQELGIDPKTMPSEEAHGIMLLPPGTQPGLDVLAMLELDDCILELDLTPNRSDCLSVLGVAREVAALLGQPLRPFKPVFPELEETIGNQVRIDIVDSNLCRRFAGRLIKNVRVGPSPLWMQQRLRFAGFRPISNIVDVTNYVMLELGQPMHAFDYNLLKDGRIIVRPSEAGEKIVSLDGTERSLEKGSLLITDPSGPVAIAGVMGGLATEVNENTSAVLLESAFFNPTSIRRTSKALGLRSEASLRFEKGIDIGGCHRAADRAAQLIYEVGAGEVVRGAIDNYPFPAVERTVSLRPDRVVHVLGMDVDRQEAKRILDGLQFKVYEAGSDLLVSVPTWRVDVGLEIDLIEEIARMHGYDRAPVTLPFGTSTHGSKTREQAFHARIRNLMTASGLLEVVTYSFVHPRVFDQVNMPEGSACRSALKIQNPLSEEQSVMRTVLLPSLFQVLARNYSRRVQHGAIFELGKIYQARGEERLPEERLMLAAAAMGQTAGGWDMASRQMDFYYLKGVLDHLFSKLGTRPAAFSIEDAEPAFHPGRTARIIAGEVVLGVLGEIHPSVIESYELPERVVAFEIDLANLLAVSGQTVRHRPLPRYPAIERDMAFVVRQDTPAAEIIETIWGAGGELLESVSLFDVYRGGQVPQGYQSMAFALTFLAQDRTLTDAEASERVGEVARALAGRFGAELRG